MLSENDLQGLAQARHPDPFAVLGMHADVDGHLWVRVLLPGASEVTLLDTGTGEPVAEVSSRSMPGLDRGFFEAAVTGRQAPFDYRLRVRIRIPRIGNQR